MLKEFLHKPATPSDRPVRPYRARRDRTTAAPACRRVVALVAVALIGAGVAQAGPVAVVAHPTVEVDDLNFAEFRKIILGDRRFWAAGKQITLIVRSPVADERTLLLERVYKMSEAQYRQYWVAKVFRAEVTSGPRVVLSNTEAVDLVGALEGAITLVDLADVPEGLKVLKIDGHLPGEPEYPFN
jgi:hypothetical protein